MSGPHPTYFNGRSRRAIDHVYSKGLSSLDVMVDDFLSVGPNEHQGSDHNAVKCKLYLKEECIARHEEQS
jgi:hypothetical protein